MVFNIEYLFCLSILLSIFKPWARTESFTATAAKKSRGEVDMRIIDVNEFITNEEKRLEALKNHLMTAEESYALCKEFYMRGDLRNTLTWSMETLRKYKEEATKRHSFTEVDVLEYIAYVHYLLGDIKNALRWTKKLLKLEPNHPRAAGNVPQYEDIIAEQERASQNRRNPASYETEDEKANAIKLNEEMHESNVAKIHLLTAADCFDLSKDFYYKKDYTHSLVWSMESLHKYKEESNEEHSFTEVEVLEYIAFTYYLMDDIKTALEWTKKLLKLDPNHPRAAGNVPRYEGMIARQDKKGYFNKLSEEIHQFDVAKSLKMTAADCFELGKALYHKNEYNNSLAWNMESLRKYENETTEEHTFAEVDLLEYIAFTHYLIGDVKTALEWTKKLLKLDPNHPQAVANVPYFEKAIADVAATKKRGETGDNCEYETTEDQTEEMPEFNVAKSRLMTAQGCFDLCRGFYFKNDFGNALAWGMEALHKFKEETDKWHSFTEVEVLEYIAFSHNIMGDIKSALNWTKALLELDPNHPRAAGNVPLFEKAIAEQEAATKKKGDDGEFCEDDTTEDETQMPKFDVVKTNYKLYNYFSRLMTAQECFDLCQGSYFKNDFGNALAWGMEALQKFKEETNQLHSFTEVEVLEYISSSHSRMGDLKSALDWTKKLLELEPDHPRAVFSVVLFKEAIAEKEAATEETVEESEDKTTEDETEYDTEDDPEEMPKFDVAKSRLMTAQGCFDLCIGFYFKNDFDNALAWGMEALHKLKEETDKKHSFTEVRVLEYIAYIHYRMGYLKSALDWTKKLLELDPKHPRAAGNLLRFEKAIAEQEPDTGDEIKDGKANSIMRSEEMDKLDIAQSHLMTPAACFKHSKALYFKNDFKNSLVWSMETLRKYKAETDKKHSFTEVDVLEYISFSHYMMGDGKTALEWIQELLKLDPDHPRAASHKSLFEKAIAEQEAAKKKRQGTGVPTEDVKDEKAKPNQIISDVAHFGPDYQVLKRRYEALCRGEMEIDSDVAKRLFCRYVSETHPFLRLAPIKAEQVYIDPDVFVFHDVLSDDEIETIKVLSMPRLQRATVNKAIVIGGTTTNVASYRIGKSAWLNDEDSPVVARVSQRVADMTGLSVASAEDLQVVNYGIGGQYEPHVDFAPLNNVPFSQQDGNRIATVLFYMSDVARGGATVFTELDLSVIPERGAALYFLNLLPSGEGDTATRHAACPVLQGTKWVCNKWIHEGGQELTKPCSWDLMQ